MKKVWWKESVVYQIYPRSFCDSNGDGIGDLRGIIGKLDYLKRLGVDILWLSPIYQSPNDDNGYDISDYRAIMKDFGTLEDFTELLEEAHKRNLRIIMDLVVNHTSDEHAWFAESRRGNEEYRDYYIWKEGKNGNPPNNWGSWFSGPAWEYDEQRGMYYLHIFSKKQPDLNWENKKVRREVYDMMLWWLDKGVDGFRMDVISMISKRQDFPDGELLAGGYGNLTPFCAHGPRVHEYLHEMNQEVLSKYDIMTVGEASCVTLEEAKKYAGEDRGELDTVFQFEHMELGNGAYGKWSDAPVRLTELKAVFDKWEQGLNGIGWNTLFWSNHDQPRAVSRFGDDGRYWELSAKMLGTCLHMMKGTPYIYQGEELGMLNAGFTELSQYRDLESINAYHELVEENGMPKEQMLRYLQKRSRDNARTPMQWDDSAYGGFSICEPWIGVNPNYKYINAKAQINDPASIYNYYQQLIKLRHEKEIIVYGDFEMLLPESEEIFAYRRSNAEEELLVVCNFTDKKIELPLDTMKYQRLLGNYQDTLWTELRPYEAVVFEKEI